MSLTLMKANRFKTKTRLDQPAIIEFSQKVADFSKSQDASGG
jgi:hypothetical protein